MAEGGKLVFTDGEEAKRSFEVGEDVVFYAVPEDGYQMDQVKAADAAGQEIEMTATDNIYHLKMPESDVKVTPVFSQIVETVPDEKQEPEPVQTETQSGDENEGLEEEAGGATEEVAETESVDESAIDESLPKTENAVRDAETVTQPEGGEAEATEEPVEESETPEPEETAAEDESKDPEKEEKAEDEGKEAPNDEKAGTKEEKENKPAEMQWISLSSDEVDAMVGIASVRRRAMLLASATTIYEGNMNRFYGAATPHLYDSNGNLVYCVLPWSASPNGVNVSFNDYNITSASDGNLQLMAKLMYYGYGGGGNILGGYSAADQEAITHFALSYVWMIYMGNTHGYGDWTSSGKNAMTEPLVVLVNENSASASEIFTGAVKDHGVGTIVGTVTYGKGIVQDVYTLSDGTVVKLTIQHYYTPNGNDIHLKGITPDIEVENSETEELQLAKAVEVLSH